MPEKAELSREVELCRVGDLMQSAASRVLATFKGRGSVYPSSSRSTWETDMAVLELEDAIYAWTKLRRQD